MKKILITGANSYIGTSFENWIKQFDGYTVDTVDTLNERWKTADFSAYDVVFHVAGLAHSDTRNPTDDVKKMYYKINTDLTVEMAKKSKADGVRQFIFMSSMIVFGSKDERITKDTEPCPDNFYGDSKLKADIAIHELESSDFKVVSLRPPMIYGRGSKGNYPVLAKFAKKTFIFPKYCNQRSMLYIENLCNFVKIIIDNEETGFFYPQNKEYVNTSDLVKKISEISKRKLVLTGIFKPFICLLSNNAYIRKIFREQIL